MKETNEVVCPQCEKKFESTIPAEEKPRCYWCILMEISNGCPEEGDMNSAKIMSGTMTADEKKIFLEEASALEEGRSSHSWFSEEYEPEERCYICGEYLCRCP